MALYNTGLPGESGAGAGEVRRRAGRTRVSDWDPWGSGTRPRSALDCMASRCVLLRTDPGRAAWLAGGRLGVVLRASARGRRADHVALPVIAVLFSLSLPATLPLWQVALGSADRHPGRQGDLWRAGTQLRQPRRRRAGRSSTSPIPERSAATSVWVPVRGIRGPRRRYDHRQLGPGWKAWKPPA